MNNRAEIEDNSIRLLKRQGLWSLDLQSKVRAMDDMDLRAFEEKMKRWNRENPHPITARQEALAVCFLIADSTKEVGRLLKMKPNATKAAKKRLIQKFRKKHIRHSVLRQHVFALPQGLTQEMFTINSFGGTGLQYLK